MFGSVDEFFLCLLLLRVINYWEGREEKEGNWLRETEREKKEKGREKNYREKTHYYYDLTNYVNRYCINVRDDIDIILGRGIAFHDYPKALESLLRTNY